MTKQILITGGAGFIGSHLADELLAHGYAVRILDNLSEQVHGDGDAFPDYVSPDVEVVEGDVCNPADVALALRDVDAVYHLAAAVGVGQSMYQLRRYTHINNMGTAVLLEALADHPVERLIVASSMSIYGEGLYRTARGDLRTAVTRDPAQIKAGQWEPCDADGEPLVPIPTSETKQPDLASIYALSKYDQERMCLIFGRAYAIPTVALRFFNVYGTRQALSNPYTGVLAIFACRFLNDKPPLIYEDGHQRRDFVNVHDVAQACRLALETPDAAGQVFNVGSGHSYTIRELAECMAETLDRPHLQPQITHTYRVGDIRHCFADITRARTVLGYAPRIGLREGIADLADWLAHQVAEDRVEMANRELAARGLTV